MGVKEKRHAPLELGTLSRGEWMGSVVAGKTEQKAMPNSKDVKVFLHVLDDRADCRVDGPSVL